MAPEIRYSFAPGGKNELSFAEMMSVQNSMAQRHTRSARWLPLSITSKQGWYKIEETCDQAIADGYNYAWVDTICIDKSSSAELSEAIIPMYRWYRQAAKCYVYLYDVYLDKDDPDASAKFCASQWFKRGWTLQELIAPNVLEFSGNHWQRLGDKESRIHELLETAGIVNEISVRHSSIARIFSWASRRTTTRIEDHAYSLIGLFKVSMMPMYGEGERAFILLQEILVSHYEDDSIFAPSAGGGGRYWRQPWRGSQCPCNMPMSSIFATSLADFANSDNVTIKNGLFCCEPGPTVENTSYGVRISRMGFRIPEVNAEDCEIVHRGLVYVQLNCYSKEAAFERAPVGLIFEIWGGDGSRLRCVRRSIVGLPGAPPVPGTFKQLIEEKIYGSKVELVHQDVLVARHNPWVDHYYYS